MNCNNNCSTLLHLLSTAVTFDAFCNNAKVLLKTLACGSGVHKLPNSLKISLVLTLYKGLSAQAPFDVWKARKVSQNQETKLVLVFEKDTMNLKGGVIFIYLFIFVFLEP